MRNEVKTRIHFMRIILPAISLLILCVSQTIAGPIVSIEPRVTVVDPSDIFEVAIRIDAGVDTISNFQVIFDFNDDVIEFLEAIEGSLYTSSGLQTWFFYDESPPETVEVFDVIFPAMSFLLPPGELVRLRFRAIADGATDIRILSVDVQDILRVPLTDVFTVDGTVCVGDASTGVEGGSVGIRNWDIGDPFPNPARGETRIRLVRPQTNRNIPCRMNVFDISGRLVKVMDKQIPFGSSEIVWDGRDSSGGEVPPGVYFFRLETDTGPVTRKVILVR